MIRYAGYGSSFLIDDGCVSLSIYKNSNQIAKHIAKPDFRHVIFHVATRGIVWYSIHRGMGSSNHNSKVVGETRGMAGLGRMTAM